MVILCYHNGALGHATAALIECCTYEGRKDFPPSYHGKNLHHYLPDENLFNIRHPECDIAQEKTLGNTVASSTSKSIFGKLLILLMGLTKWVNDEPTFGCPVVYKQIGETYGEQLEILSITIMDKIKNDNDWLVDADCVLDIVNYWNNIPDIVNWLKNCGFTPVNDRVVYFCNQIAKSNQMYYDRISKCNNIVNDIITTDNDYQIDLSFYEVAMCHAMLLDYYNRSHVELKLLISHPTRIQSLREIFHG
jgi:hypothetical protein